MFPPHTEKNPVSSSPHTQALNLRPLQINSTTNEPFLPLPAPFLNVIITPPRPATDPADTVHILNDPRVHPWLAGVPFPYTLVHATRFLTHCAEESDRILHELSGSEVAKLGMAGKAVARDVRWGPTKLPLVSGCPVQILREVKEDGSDVYIGDIVCRRSNFFHVLDPEEAKILEAANERRELGDPEIVWSIGDYLASAYHSRGIMTVAARTLMTEWMIPRMGAQHIVVSTNKGNIGSVRVFEKNGFVMTATIDDCKVMPESKGGGMFGLHVLEWRVDAKK